MVNILIVINKKATIKWLFYISFVICNCLILNYIFKMQRHGCIVKAMVVNASSS